MAMYSRLGLLKSVKRDHVRSSEYPSFYFDRVSRKRFDVQSR
jgi:hypothetical protein